MSNMIHIAGRTYEVITDHKNGWNPEVFRDRYSEVLERYDYIVGDWGYNQLRLRGFFKENNPKATKESSIACLQDYLNEYCNFGCAYFVLERMPQKNTSGDGEEESGFSLHEETSSIEDGPPVYGVRAEKPQQSISKPQAATSPAATVSNVKPQQRPQHEKTAQRQQSNGQAGKQGAAFQTGQRPQQAQVQGQAQQQGGKPNAKQHGPNGAGKAPQQSGGKPLHSQHNQQSQKRQQGKQAPSAASSES